jgi:hypothetical protein
MKFVNPLYYPLAVLAGGITLFLGVRLAKVSSAIMLPVAILVTTGAAVVRATTKSPTFHLDNPQVERELQLVEQQAQSLAKKAEKLSEEATGLLEGNGLGMMEAVRDRATKFPELVEQFSLKIASSDLILATRELEKQIARVKAKQKISTGIAKEQLEELGANLDHHLGLVSQGQDPRLGQVVTLSRLIHDAAEALEALQEKLQTPDLEHETIIQEVQALSNQIKRLHEQIILF